MKKPQKHEFGRMLKETTTKLDLAMNNKVHVVDIGHAQLLQIYQASLQPHSDVPANHGVFLLR